MPDELHALRQQLLNDILGQEDITLTEEQMGSLGVFLDFFRAQDGNSTLLLTGAAGTGKTFLIHIFSRFLRRMGHKVVLLAPTGRAAKVISARTGRLAYTIHHHIYSPVELGVGRVTFDLKANNEPTDTVYIVDEASMIGDRRDDTSRSGLLHDLLAFVFRSDDARKLILVGDPVQLPPVGHSDSPALDPGYLADWMHLNVFHAHLQEVKRQRLDSGILENAIRLRDAYTELRAHGDATPPVLIPRRDVLPLENSWEGLESYIGYFNGDLDRAIFITYSNGYAVRVNQAIRRQLHETEAPLVPGDLVMVVRNNYTYGDPKRMPFIANGDMGIVTSVPEVAEHAFGMDWMEVEIEFADASGEPYPVVAKVPLDLLASKAPQLSEDTLSNIYEQRRRMYLDMGMSKTEFQNRLQTDPYIHALQIKYGYCITGHKSQGGQWENAIVAFERDYGNDYANYLRWAYTVITRAERRLMLLDCPFWGEG